MFINTIFFKNCQSQSFLAIFLPPAIFLPLGGGKRIDQNTWIWQKDKAMPYGSKSILVYILMGGGNRNQYVHDDFLHTMRFGTTGLSSSTLFLFRGFRRSPVSCLKFIRVAEVGEVAHTSESMMVFTG